MAYRRALRLAGPDAAIEHVFRWSFPCAQLCDGCGRLRWAQDETAGDPHRRTPPSHDVRCNHCGGRSWIDLQQPVIADALVDSERYDRGTRRRLALRNVGFIATLGLVALATFVAARALPAFGVIVGVFGLAGLSVLVDRLRADLPKRQLPRRWSMALPPRAGTRAIATGPAVAEHTLVAPLSGRTCVAYEVAVRHDADARADLRSWALVEQRNVALDVAATRIGANEMHLDLPREAAVSVAPRLQQYFRERGVDPHATDLMVFETIVEPGATLQLHASAEGSVVATR